MGPSEVTLELPSAMGSSEPCFSWLHRVPHPKQKEGEAIGPSLVHYKDLISPGKCQVQMPDLSEKTASLSLGWAAGL